MSEKFQLWTDYPIEELGDEPGKEAPVRHAKLLEYDGDKYVTCEVDGVVTSFKSGYLYMKKGRWGKVPPVTRRILHRKKRAVSINPDSLTDNIEATGESASEQRR